MITYETILGLLLGYLLGSIPTAVWIGRMFYRIDVREYGSGNAGATNTFRVLGKASGSAVMIIDCFKGFAATNVAYFVGDFDPGTAQIVNFQLSLGIAAVLGHIYPIFAGFRGGKGIATLLGMMLALLPEAAGICLGIFIVLLIISKYVSLSSIIASSAFPILVFTLFQDTEPSLKVFGVALAVLVVATHQKNIERLLKGKESKVRFFKKKDD